MTTLHLTNFNILSTGADGGHYYITSEINYAGQTRKLTVLFKSKSDEKALQDKRIINVKGNLIDEGLQVPLMLLEAEIID